MDLRTYLEIELARRKEKNPSYSLRAFAKALSIGDGTLSKILSGKSDPTLNTKEKILNSLNISEELRKRILGADHRFFLESLDIDGDSKIVGQRLFLNDLIFELTNLRPHASEELYKKIDSIYPVDLEFFNEIIDYLKEKKIIDTNPDGDLFCHYKNISSLPDENITSNALKVYQDTLLEFSKLALRKLTTEQRSHTSMIFNLPKDQLQEIKNETREFRRRVNEIAQDKKNQSPEDSDLYALQISFFPFLD